MFYLAWRDIKVRYKQSFFGAAWAIAQPLSMMLILTLFAGHLAGIPSNGVPYPFFAYSGLLIWQLFAYALTNASNSLVVNERLITKVYFPRLILPLSSVLTGLIDFLVGSTILILMMIYYGIRPGFALAWVPLFILLAIASGTAIAVWLSAINVRYRDVRHTLAFLAQLWLLATPIAYPSSLATAAWRPLIGINPMAGAVEGFRWAISGAGEPPGMLLLISATVSVVLLSTSFLYFRKMERTFADFV
jgi:lipopolysaccharide transport system permease protein